MHIKNSLLLFIACFISFNISVNDAKAQTPSKRDSLAKGESSKVSVEPTATPIVTRETQKNDYLSSPKPPGNKVFGSSFFDSPSLSFEPNLRIATPTNYILGPDDELAINVSGYQETNIKTTIGPEGTIFIPQVGTIELSGLRIDDAIARIKGKMAQTAYPSLRSNLSMLTVSLGKIRSIHIIAIGAYKPGNFTVSSLTTVYNALLACGGPGDINTYRNIELIRNNKVFTTIDIYQFLTRGDQKGNIMLKEGDVINFPVYKKHVELRGQVKKPGIYELKDGETFENLLFFAGGYTDSAYRASVKVKQITDIERRVKDLSKTEILAYQPASGDVFTVDAVLTRVENSVNISGGVYRPGEFELTPGITISALIKRAGGLLENVFTDRATLTRTHIDGTTENITFNVSDIMKGGSADIPLIKRDNINISILNEFVVPYKISLSGEVRRPGSFDYSKNLSLKDLIYKAGGFTDAASTYNIEVSRRIISNRTQVVTDSIAIIYTLSTSTNLSIESDKFILSPFDIVVVRRNPGYVEQQSVTINGEVNVPGVYIIKSKNERVSNLIKRAGGLTPYAYLKGIYLTRRAIDNNTQQKEEIVENIQKSIKDTSSKATDDIAKTNARIPINYKKIIDDPNTVQNYVLLNGDIIEVLKEDPLVKISGEVLAANRTGFVENKGLGYYITQAGGTNLKARKSKIYVIYADGHVKRTKNGFFGLFRSYPTVEAGAEIIVPHKRDGGGATATEILGLTSGIISITTLIIVTISSLRK
ncbi:SLBB domain-containing protein [Mucilaginibacter sp. UYCu711]|uniref:SLBB domain-containing protein n=1 Tax=Mucilaginibacter sp. UYCu711 TaxID=3156339 RepID=UPI003D1A4793